jgi:serine/threonine protein kinase
MTTPSGRKIAPDLDSSSGVREPVELLAEEFLERQRRGERPTVAEYVARHPELAAAIQDLFPALLLMENLGEGSLGGRTGTVDRAAATSSGHGAIPGPVSEQLGDYRILREIGRGGMGIVYEAEQGSLGRRVALKLLPPHALATPVQVRRFEREARAAGRLHHTNIVPVFGVGRECDTHYYVMQYIQGQPLSEVLTELRRLRQAAGAASGPGKAGPDAADLTGLPTAADVAHSLWEDVFAPAVAGDLGSTDILSPTGAQPNGQNPNVPPRISGGPSADSNALVRSAAPAHSGWQYARTVARLGAQASEALDYAAQQGVLHRDVKPSNLLLDVRGTLWVTDFGLAKLSDSEDLTQTGDILGTLRYMAPERFQGQSDVRSDVYGLGLTLYELLALRPAFEETDRSRLIDMVTRAELPHLLKLDPAIPRDLATIVHKAIARDPTDRYTTAGDLAADLTRFLEDRPIRARRLSPLGVAWRWARRNKMVASLLGLVSVLVVALSAGAMIAAERYRAVAQNENHARLTADAAKKLAETRALEANQARSESDANAARANAARAEADRSAAEAKAVVAFVVDDVLGAASPSKTRGKMVTVLEALTNADRSLEAKLAKEPRVEASIRQALARVYTELGEYEKAEGHAARALAFREKALGPEHQATLDAMFTLGWNDYFLSKPDKLERGESLFRRMLEICRRTRGEEHELTLMAMNGLAAIYGRRNKGEDARKLQERILEVRQKTSGPADRKTLVAKHNLALEFMRVGKMREAEPLLREVAEIEAKNQPDDPATLNFINTYVSLLVNLGRYSTAADWAERLIEANIRVHKFKHPNAQRAIINAVRLRTNEGKNNAALRIIDPALAQARLEFGGEDPKSLDLLTMRIELLCKLGDLAEAGSSAKDLLASRTRKLGLDDLNTLDALKTLAVIRRDQGATAEAGTLLMRLRSEGQNALAKSKGKQVDLDRALRLRQLVAYAEVVARNLSRPERSNAAPGTPGGPPSIDAPLLARSPVADGRIEPGEYGAENGLPFDFTQDVNPGRLYIFDEATRLNKDPADLSARIFAAHTSTALFLAVRVRDQFIRADPVAAKVPFLNDSVELFLDGDRVPNEQLSFTWAGNREGFQMVADSLGNRFCSAPEVGDTRWKVGTSRTEDGYVIEWEIPLDLIDTQDGQGVRPAATGSELRMNLAINDVDEAVNKQSSLGMLWSEDRLWSPMLGGEDFWPVALRLVSAAARSR